MREKWISTSGVVGPVKSLDKGGRQEISKLLRTSYMEAPFGARERHRLIHTLAGLASPLFVEQWKEIVQNHLQQQQIQADHARPHFKEKEEEETSSRERKREKLISKPDSSFKLEARRKKGRSEEVDQSVWSGGGRAAHKFPL